MNGVDETMDETAALLGVNDIAISAEKVKSFLMRVQTTKILKTDNFRIEFEPILMLFKKISVFNEAKRILDGF